MTKNQTTDEHLGTGGEFRQRQKSKNLALGLAIGGLVLLVYVISIVRMGGAT